MHELFLSAVLPQEELPKAAKVLQGFCRMKPDTLIRRRLIFTGPSPPFTGFDPSFIAKQPPPKNQQWKLLSEQVMRQSYLITLKYEVKRTQFGQAESDETKEAAGGDNILDCNELSGTLRWNDIPDPRGFIDVNTRHAINIDNEKNLCSILQSNNYSFHREVIEECHRFVHKNIVFLLSRYFQLPSELENQPTPINKLPPFSSLMLYDQGNKWILTASLEVANGKDQELMKQGMEELFDMKKKFDGCFYFQEVQRQALDTKMKVKA